MSIPKFFDVHTHVPFAAFKGEEDAVIGRALDVGVWMINVGTQKDTSLATVETARKYPEGVWATVGLHPVHTEVSYHDEMELGIQNPTKEENGEILPNPPFKKEGTNAKAGLGGFTSRGEEFDYDYYLNLAKDPKVVGIGECGLDYYRISNLESGISNEMQNTKEKQKNVFLQQIKLAGEVGKPLMIHCRNAFDDLISILNSKFQIPNSLSKNPGVIHFFSGTVDDAKRLLEMGFSFSFGGVITFARDYDEVVRYIPLDRIVLETDAPYVTPIPYRGKRNEPAYVVEVAKKLAELKELPLEKVAQVTRENAVRAFSL